MKNLYANNGTYSYLGVRFFAHNPAYRSESVAEQKKWQNNCDKKGEIKQSEKRMLGRKKFEPKLMYAVSLEDLVP
ncbi:MAG: hypothetical protein NTX22_11190, partial [Ignavibacteriales bacterium]|nr:hypothetical protein [Ignavibacteriales bacterium]